MDCIKTQSRAIYAYTIHGGKMKKYIVLKTYARQQFTYCKGDVIVLDENDEGAKAKRKNYIAEYVEPKAAKKVKEQTND